MKSLARQIIESLAFSAILAVLIFGLQQVELEKELIHPRVWSIMIFSTLLGVLVVAIAHWALNSLDAQSRPNIFIGLTVLRMILSMVYLAIVIFLGLEDKMVWVANFFAVYLFYLVFEIYTILSNLRAISREGEN